MGGQQMGMGCKGMQGGMPMGPMGKGMPPMGKGMMGMPGGMQGPMNPMGMMAMRPPMPMQMMRPGMPMPMQRPAAPAPSGGAPTPGSNQPLTAAGLASAPPAVQKQIIGERLYPQVAKQQPELAGKITGSRARSNSFILVFFEGGDPILG